MPTQGRPRGSVSSWPFLHTAYHALVGVDIGRALPGHILVRNRFPQSERGRSLLVLGGIGAEQLHLDVSVGIELELWSLDRVAETYSGRREIDDDGFVALNQTIREQLVWTGIELEVLERIHVQADRERGEECRCLRLS